MIGEIKFKFIGTQPLMVQSARLANPLDPLTQEIQKYTRKKPKEKTDADHSAIMRLEFEGAFYNGAEFTDIGPYLPGENILAALRDGGKSQRKGAAVRRGLFSVERALAIKYKGPRTIEELWKAMTCVDIRGVRLNGRSTVMRCRPIFADWELSPTIRYDDQILNKAKVIEIAEYTGNYIGVGTYRPTFGRFSVEVK